MVYFKILDRVCEWVSLENLYVDIGAEMAVWCKLKLLIFAPPFPKNVPYLSVNKFSMKVKIGDTTYVHVCILKSPSKERTPFYVVIQAMRRSSHLQG